jgi:hypothetical protein
LENWLLNRLFEHTDQATPRFAFQGTINWMRALSIIVNTEEFDKDKLKAFFNQVSRRKPNIEADTRVCENVLMAMHNIAALNAFKNTTIHKYDIVRAGIISWYYSIYCACSAMVAAQSGANPQTHALTAKSWQNDIVEQNLVKWPFSLSLKNLTPKNIEREINSLKGDNDFDLNNTPSTYEEAKGAVYTYLSGTAKYVKWYIEEKVKRSSEFKRLGVSDFRKKIARELKDSKLQQGEVNFLSQAFRYRGKANYRDAIYLSYGDDNKEKIELFVHDLSNVATKFFEMTIIFIIGRVEKGIWEQFIDDLRENSRISLGIDILEVQ